MPGWWITQCLSVLLVMTCKCQARGELAESKKRPGAWDFRFCVGAGDCFYPGGSDSFAQAKRGTFAPPLPLPLEGEEAPRGGVRRGRLLRALETSGSSCDEGQWAVAEAASSACYTIPSTPNHLPTILLRPNPPPAERRALKAQTGPPLPAAGR